MKTVESIKVIKKLGSSDERVHPMQPIIDIPEPILEENDKEKVIQEDDEDGEDTIDEQGKNKISQCRIASKSLKNKIKF